VEGLDATVVVGGPAAVLVAADFAFEPVHERPHLTVYGHPSGKRRRIGQEGAKKSISTRSAQITKRATDERGVRDEARGRRGLLRR
jgi:hypothetical protein